MCGKYYYDSTTFSFSEEDEDKTDLNPAQDIPVYLLKDQKIVLTRLNWGYTSNARSEKIINAKSETIEEKITFKDDFLQRRCVIAAKGFYQKDSAGHYVCFESKQKKTLYMLGIYRHIKKEVVIITTKPNDVMKPIHNRMPLIIPKEFVKAWLYDVHQAREILHYYNDDLEIITGHVQQSLFEE